MEDCQPVDTDLPVDHLPVDRPLADHQPAACRHRWHVVIWWRWVGRRCVIRRRNIIRRRSHVARWIVCGRIVAIRRPIIAGRIVGRRIRICWRSRVARESMIRRRYCSPIFPAVVVSAGVVRVCVIAGSGRAQSASAIPVVSTTAAEGSHAASALRRIPAVCSATNSAAPRPFHPPPKPPPPPPIAPPPEDPPMAGPGAEPLPFGRMLSGRPEASRRAAIEFGSIPVDDPIVDECSRAVDGPRPGPVDTEFVPVVLPPIVDRAD